MEETRATAKLPNLSIEITHRQSENGEAEFIAMRITAEPSFKAFGAFLDQHGGPPMVGWMAMMPWLQMMQAAWQRWLKLMGAPLSLPGSRGEAGEAAAGEDGARKR